MSYFSQFTRFGSLARSRRNTTSMAIPIHVSELDSGPTSPTDEDENFQPFIPPGCEMDGEEVVDNDEPVIPNNLLKIKAYRYRPSKGAWKHAITSGMGNNPDREMEVEERKPYCTQVKIITWNVDMMSPHPEERLTTALRHIEMDVLKCKSLSSPPEPCCILLQEVKDTVLPHLLEDEWVRRWFVVTPFTKDKWPEEAWYGNITLVSRSLHIAECHILHYGLTAMQRTALCVKLKLNHPGTHEKAIVSIVNTHLESLKDGAIARPKQMEMCARFLRLRGVHGGIVAGDMNSISPEDGTIGKEVGLRDAWRQGDVEDGKTWGFQGQNEGKFPTNRLDKVFYLPGMGYKVEEPRRIGVGLKTRAGEEDEHWVSDHYGLETTLQMLKPRSNSA